ncbi:MAG: cation:proton antiporter [Deltaproteobacteria bacterium]|nr:cation:proton antiporter [Deltaproteobacteria bacterium]
MAKTLSMFSWVGAILLLLIAGLEADLDVLSANIKPGVMAAMLAIVSSIVAGTLFARLVLDSSLPGGIFLGLVLSVTGVSVAAKILFERGSLRRSYAQVILAAGISSEVLVWLLISAVAALRENNALMEGLRSFGLALLFFLFMWLVGRRFIFWAMRRVTDLMQVINGQLSLVIVLSFLSAALTQVLGLHPLLGAFAFGVLLGQAPRATPSLRESIQAVTVSLFAPTFFVLAGMRVDIIKLGNVSAIEALLLLLALATFVKVTATALGARLGGLGLWESSLVGIGVNLKGGTDVIVAIVGVQMGLLSQQTYTTYAMVAILTVMFSPPLLALIGSKTPPSSEEMARLNREEARRRAYLASMERVLIPLYPSLLPGTVASVIENIARAKETEGETFDITELVVEPDNLPDAQPSNEVVQAEVSLSHAEELARVEITRRQVTEPEALRAILEAAHNYELVAIGAPLPGASPTLSFGKLQDQIIGAIDEDILVVVQDGPLPSSLKRILAPINGLEYSAAATDVAAYLAKSHNAELVLFTVMHSRLDSLFWKGLGQRQLFEAGYRLLRETRFRVERLGVRCGERVQLGEDPGEEILRELERRPYDLVVLGAVGRSSQGNFYLGRSVHSVLMRGRTATMILITHGQEA